MDRMRDELQIQDCGGIWCITRNGVVIRPADEIDKELVERINTLEAQLSSLSLYSEAVAEVCDEDIFNRIESEWNLRKEARDE